MIWISLKCDVFFIMYLAKKCFAMNVLNKLRIIYLAIFAVLFLYINIDVSSIQGFV